MNHNKFIILIINISACLVTKGNWYDWFYRSYFVRLHSFPWRDNLIRFMSQKQLGE